MAKNKRYLVEVQETTGSLGGHPRIAGTRLGLDILAEWGLDKFKKSYPETGKAIGWWSPSIKELKSPMKDRFDSNFKKAGKKK